MLLNRQARRTRLTRRKLTREIQPMASRAYSRAGIIAKLFGQPLAVMPETAAHVLGAIGPRLDVSQLFVPESGARFGRDELRSMAAAEVSRIEAASPMEMLSGKVASSRLSFVHNRVAHIPLRGELVDENDGAVQPSSGFTGYDGIRAQVMAADNDPNVGGLLLDVNSPGGLTADLFELADFLMARRGTKPMRAVIRDCGASAAYTLACCADEVTLHQLGVAGSNGVITMHADFSKSLEQDGVAVTLIASGTHKADGNPFEPLPPDVRARIQTMVNTSAERLFAHVAKARGLTADAVRDQQGRIYMGEDAVTAGLVDKIMSWQDSTAEFEALVNGSGTRPAATAPVGARSAKGNSMSIEATAPAANNQPDINEAALAAATASGHAAGHTEGLQAGAQAERERLTALAELDAATTISPALAAAIAEGTSAGDFAIGLARAAKTAGVSALANAQADALAVGDLPESGAAALGARQDGAVANRGAAYATKRAAGK
jgi:signal peptide peptidase SppA